MGKQLLFCVETDKTARTDVIYIKETIKRFYGSVPNTIKIDFICMGSKNKYKTRGIASQIKEKTKMYTTLGETTVIYCIDTDGFEKDAVQKKDFEEISKYCDEHNYRLIWFCHDVEEVFLGQTVDKSDKKKLAIEFQIKKKIDNIEKRNLSSKKLIKHKSNILMVLDELLKE